MTSGKEIRSRSKPFKKSNLIVWESAFHIRPFTDSCKSRRIYLISSSNKTREAKGDILCIA